MDIKVSPRTKVLPAQPDRGPSGNETPPPAPGTPAGTRRDQEQELIRAPFIVVDRVRFLGVIMQQVPGETWQCLDISVMYTAPPIPLAVDISIFGVHEFLFRTIVSQEDMLFRVEWWKRCI